MVSQRQKSLRLTSHTCNAWRRSNPPSMKCRIIKPAPAAMACSRAWACCGLLIRRTTCSSSGANTPVLRLHSIAQCACLCMSFFIAGGLLRHARAQRQHSCLAMTRVLGLEHGARRRRTTVYVYEQSSRVGLWADGRSMPARQASTDLIAGREPQTRVDGEAITV